MEDLNRQQLILLTLLVSFVTSIATGIITATLLQEAPVEVTQTINRVVERTIETVAPEAGKGEIVREVEVVSEEDLVLESIDKNIKSIARVKTLSLDGTEIVTGLGLVVAEGVVAVDSRSFSSGSNYSVTFHDDKTYNVARNYTDNGFVYLKIGKPANEKYTYYPALLSSADSLKLGQTVVAISGKTSNAVAIGRVAEIETGSDTSKSVSKVITDIRHTRSQPGSPLLNLSGEIVGMEAPMSETDATLVYVPIQLIKDSVKNAQSELNK